jgi:uncharacterized protein YmfQ (DUF2313 family)
MCDKTSEEEDVWEMLQASQDEHLKRVKDVLAKGDKLLASQDELLKKMIVQQDEEEDVHERVKDVLVKDVIAQGYKLLARWDKLLASQDEEEDVHERVKDVLAKDVIAQGDKLLVRWDKLLASQDELLKKMIQRQSELRNIEEMMWTTYEAYVTSIFGEKM